MRRDLSRVRGYDHCDRLGGRRVMRSLSELVVLMKGNGERGSGVVHRLHHGHFRGCTPCEWIGRVGKGIGLEVMVMLWIMCCPQGLKWGKIRI